MFPERIVSFLPSATEMICALGLSNRLVGITHECDYPPEIRGKPVVVTGAIPEKLSPQEVDTAVRKSLNTGQSLYRIDENLLKSLAPDLIVTQDLCQVCAPSGNETSQVLKMLPSSPSVLCLTPQSLHDILDNILQLGQATGKLKEAEALFSERRNRLRDLQLKIGKAEYRPRVFFMEWPDPVYCGGHWMGELIEIAGGIDRLSRKGKDSIRICWDDVLDWSPEVLISAPCGFNLDEALRVSSKLPDYPEWNSLPAVQNSKVYVVDANAYFARPGPRVVEGAELLAWIIHPERFGPDERKRWSSSCRTLWGLP